MQRLTGHSKRVLLMMMMVFFVWGMVQSGSAQANAASKGYKFTYAKETIMMGQTAAGFIKAAGAPDKKTAKKSCAYDGKDITRKYEDFILYTYTNSNSSAAKEYISGITFLTENVSTAEGIMIGSSKDDVIKAYGKKAPKYGIYTYTKGHTKLQIEVSGSKVTNIRYVLK